MFRYFFAYETDIPEGLTVKNFSPTHILWLAAAAASLFLLLRIYRRRNGEARRRFARTAMLVLLLLEAVRQAWALAAGHYDAARHLLTLPGGVMILIAAAAVFTEKPALKEFSYACGLPGAATALLLPETGYPFWNIQYLQGIAIHMLLALVPLLWICGDGFRPNIRALPKNMLILLGLAALCYGVNTALGGNCMFLRYAPEGSPIALMNQWVGWPWYIGLLPALALVVLLLMYAPWAFAERRKKTSRVEYGMQAEI